jgi:subtilisin family serine protease
MTSATGSVLIEVEKDDKLVSTAEAFLDRRDYIDIMKDYRGPFDSTEIEIDLNFGALAVGPGSSFLNSSAARETALRPSFLLEAFRPKNSNKFVIRGFVKTSDALARFAKDRTDTSPIFHSDPSIVGLLGPPRPTCGTSPYVGDADTVRLKLDTATLAGLGLDGTNVAIAIVDTGIFLPRITQLLGDIMPSGYMPNIDQVNSWSENVVTKPFGHRIGHGTMCAYDALIAAPQATLLDYSMLLARPDGYQRLPVTIAAAMRAYIQLINFWLLNAPSPPYPSALVVNNSWGTFHPSEDPNLPGSLDRYIDNSSHIFRLPIYLLTVFGADIIFSGNNCGCCCPSATCLSQTSGMIMGANSYPEVLTIGGCDTNDDLVGYSSRGPSIAGMKPEKPDLVAYTHFLGSKARRIYLPDTGVSAAGAVAAGCVAALRTLVSPNITSSSQLFNVLRSTARNAPGPGWDRGFGYGIIDPVAAAGVLLP